MQILLYILYFLIFIVFISLLILIHELGHFAMAKAFKVYCIEFSIGMGPAIFKKKRKNGETTFALRGIPFGGYVSMFDGNSSVLPNGVEVDPTRSLNSIKKWKRAIIMVAGVVMNAVLAYTILFINAFVPQHVFYEDKINVLNTNLGVNVGEYDIACQPISDSALAYDFLADVYYKDGSTKEDVAAVADFSTFTFKQLDIGSYINFFNYTSYEEDGNFYVNVDAENIIDISKVNYVSFKFKLITGEVKNPEGKVISYTTQDCQIIAYAKLNETGEEYYYESIGVETATTYIQAKNLGEGIVKAGKSFGTGASLIVNSLGALFSKPAETIGNTGGIIAVGFTTTNTLTNYGVYYFLNLWGIISINLAIINLLPFPGLDGWHLLVLAIEGITRKKIPEKVKNVVSFVGLALLMILMVMFLFKDTLTYIFSFAVLGALL